MSPKFRIKHIFQIVAGALFLVSGLLKALDSQSFYSLINAYGFGWAGFTAPVISSIEIIFGLCLLLNILPETTALFAAVFTVLFTLLYSYAYFFRGVEESGCMGTYIKVQPFLSFLRNGLIIIMCLWIWKNSENKGALTRNWKKWVIWIIGGISLCVSGYTLNVPLVQNEKIHIGDPVNSTIFQCFENKISKDTCIIFIFRPDCDHCWNSTENVKSIKQSSGISNVIGITYADADTAEFMLKMKPNFEVLKYPTNELYDFVVGVPVLMILRNGRVIRIFEAADIPCGQMLRKML